MVFALNSPKALQHLLNNEVGAKTLQVIIIVCVIILNCPDIIVGLPFKAGAKLVTMLEVQYPKLVSLVSLYCFLKDFVLDFLKCILIFEYLKYNR